MAFLLILGLLVAGICPSVHGRPGSMLDPGVVIQEDQQNQTPVDNLRLAASNADFAFSLYKQLALRNPNENVIFSPLSISMALAFLSLGARGTTRTEILKGLKFNLTDTSETEVHLGFQHLLRSLSQPSSSLQLSMGNAMFVNEQLRLLDKFRADAQVLYASEAFPIAFWDSAAAEKLINDYVMEKTQGKIVDLVKNIDPSTVVILVNYIFFKGECPRGVRKETECIFQPSGLLLSWCSNLCYQRNHYLGGCPWIVWGMRREDMGTVAHPAHRRRLLLGISKLVCHSRI